MFNKTMINLLDLDKEGIKKITPGKPFRAAQVFHWVFARGIQAIDEMSNLPKDLRHDLGQIAEISYPEIAGRQVSSDKTEKIAWRLYDGHIVESVIIPEKNHWTVCVSSQAGCAMGCNFCYTAQIGFKRNLSQGEILAQILYPIHAYPKRHIRNIVFMGMGEPLLNYDNLVDAIHILTDKDGPQISKRRITISTCGIIPRIKTLWPDTGVNLAISLNAPNDALRSQIMPINNKYPLKELLGLLRTHPTSKRGRITMEYVLIGGLNDQLSHAEELIRTLHGIRSKVNLIPFNPWPQSTLKAPEQKDLKAFHERLRNSPVAVMLRKEKGSDILAACGQLAGKKGK
ncbi:MAG: 23S rRNA (adenine(2503)-C(2))-methyltransferase RlmN [Thermodesulfobacteriota bacterium]|nr:23S rRNA (adenine(2503)-C(2))-methyltransferase RlmN [Thermodesulfobacteriota bacterium]